MFYGSKGQGLIGVFSIVCQWKLFKKAGKKGWEAIVPVYNMIVLFEISKTPLWMIILFFIPVANFVVIFKLYINLAKQFGKDTVFGIGLVFLPIVFLPILAFGNNNYIDNSSTMSNVTDNNMNNMNNMNNVQNMGNANFINNSNSSLDLGFSPQPNNNNLYVDKSKKYINDNLNIILTCKDIADYCHINEIHLNRLFKKYTGETLHKHIQRKKIDYSIELLKNKDLSLSTISAMLGFPNEYYFNTYFKNAVGLPPGAYRNINLKTE